MKTAEELLHVLDGVEFEGSINTTDEVILENVKHSIRLQHTQVRLQPVQSDRVILVGGGPSLEATLPELLELYYDGAKVVTVNGAYRWCIERNIRPSAQIVLDAQARNAKFVEPALPQCRYLIASQCAPETWKAVEGRPNVRIWHAAAEDNVVLKPVLDEFYLGQWMPTPGGTTVIVRALLLLRAQGFLRFDIFGADSCFMGGKHHAYEQKENDVDGAYPVTIQPPGHPELARTFLCAPWMVKQLECFLQTVRLHGHHFLLNVHGDGLLAYALKCSADVEITQGTAANAAEKE